MKDNANAPPPAPAAPPPPAAPPTAPDFDPPPTGAVSSASGGTAAVLGSLDAITVPRVVLNCVEGWGKTSTGAFAPNPAILCAAGENGYQTLKGAGLVPDIPGGLIESWPDFLATLRALGVECPYQTLVLDALGGFEAMCHQYVGQRDFDGDMGKHGFQNYHNGYEIAARVWCEMLIDLDKIHAQGVAIIALSHCQDKKTNNVAGDDYMKTVGSLHHKAWAPTKRWADAVLVGTFKSIIDKKKGIGGADRVLYCEHRDAYDAKNRYRMPPEIDIPKDPALVWGHIINAMRRKEA